MAVAAVASQAKPGKSRWPARLDLLQSLSGLLLALFLIVAHVAMIFGMLDPTLFTGADPMAAMPGMAH